MKRKSNEKPQTCKSCSTKFQGKFCPQCGEKVIDENDYSILTFINNIFNAFTNIDSNFLKSFYLLIKKPGFLSKEYIIGKRVDYLKPMQIFLIANLIYFIVQPFTGINGFNTPLNTQINRLPYSNFTKEMVTKRIMKLKQPFKDFEREYNRKSTNYAKTLILLMTPMLALLLNLLYFRSKRFFVEHLVFSIHFFAFYLFYVFSLGFFILHLFIFIFPWKNLEFYLTIINLLIIFIYFYFSLSFFYQEKRFLTVFKSFILSTGVILLIFIYRFILFFVTFFSIKA